MATAAWLLSLPGMADRVQHRAVAEIHSRWPHTTQASHLLLAHTPITHIAKSPPPQETHTYTHTKHTYLHLARSPQHLSAPNNSQNNLIIPRVRRKRTSTTSSFSSHHHSCWHVTLTEQSTQKAGPSLFIYHLNIGVCWLFKPGVWTLYENNWYHDTLNHTESEEIPFLPSPSDLHIHVYLLLTSQIFDTDFISEINKSIPEWFQLLGNLVFT